MHGSKRFGLQGSSRGRKFPLPLVVITITTIIIGSTSSHGADLPGACSPVIGRLVSLQGQVELQRATEPAWSRVTRLETTVCSGDRLRAGSASRAAVFLQPENLIRVDQHSELQFSQTADETLIEFFQQPATARTDLTGGCGAGYVITRFPRMFRIRTPHLNAAVEGTEFLVAMRCDATELTIFEGKVLAEVLATMEQQSLNSGQVLTAGGAEPPAIKVLVRPADAVQWALYYPPLTDAGVPLLTADECEQLPAGAMRQTCFARRGEHFLRLGRVEQAEAEIAKALADTPATGDALALQTVIRVVKNDKEGALAAAQRAIEVSPESSLAWLALSYAQQASFKLEDATYSVKRATELAPNSSLAQARLAELHMSSGRIRDAERAAQRATEIAPNEARAHMVLGFVSLAMIDTRRARQSFERAIELDSAEPLARLGFGLAEIREGRLAAGREQLEIAVALDPQNSLLRSYLGKAYYEENTRERDQLAETQFGLAKELDPNDPTPWYYSAILKRTENRLVESLDTLHESIVRNDNRAVYRSKLLLDEDKAARAVGLAQSYRELGFDQRALLEATKSLSHDPRNIGGHRFLADAYASLPRHDIARQSEALQARLRHSASLQSPIPDATTSDRFARGLFRDVGPTRTSLYEFSPLYLRNGIRLELSGVSGSNDTSGTQASLTALKDRFAFAFSHLEVNTDGFRPNNDFEKRLHNAVLHYDISEATSAQIELRSFETRLGDPFLRFDPDLFFDDRGAFDGRYFRLGTRHDVSSETELLASYIHIDATNVAEIPNILSITEDFKTHTAELQVTRRVSRLGHVSAGIGYFAEKKDVSTTFGFSAVDTIHARNAYVYASISEPDPRYTVQIGASYDYIGSEVGVTDSAQELLNPKLGILWHLGTQTTLRAAGFRVLKRRLLTSETLEPTQIGGFNQFFDDPEGTEYWRYGLGLDHRISSSVLMGLEASNRDLRVPQGGNIDEWREVLGRGYLYWHPNHWVAASLSYEHEKLDRDPTSLGADLFAQSTTEIVPLSLSFFSHFGGSLRVITSYARQKGVFATAPFFSGLSTGSDTFWITDIDLTYRLPRRSGLVSARIRNLFEEEFRFQETDVVHPRFARRRFVMLQGTFTLP